MKCLFSLLSSLLVIIQVNAQFSEDFSDGEFSSNPTWGGQTDRFIIEQGELRLNASQENGDSYLTVESSGLDNGTWEFLVKMDFGTSGSNFTKVYLMSTSDALNESLNGYFVLIGDTQDEISLYRQDGSEEVVIIDGVDKEIDIDPVEVRIRVTRDENGTWELLRDLTGGSSFSSIGTTTDNNYRVTSFFGVRCTYTSTRHDLFFFDDFEVTGTPILDMEPPELVSVVAKNETSVEVIFSEEVNSSSVQLSDFVIDQGISVSEASYAGNIVSLKTSNLTNGRFYNLEVSGIEDMAGNAIEGVASLQFRLLIYSEPLDNELLLTEVLFNPKTGGNDFVELYNNSDKYFNLSNWQLARISDDELEQIETISFEELTIEPNRYLAFTEDSEALAFDYREGELSNFVTIADLPAYNDDVGTVVLLSPNQDTIQYFEYDEDLHFELLSDVEGVSLERISFSGNENDPNLWRSASSVVGFATPGRANSQFIETSDSKGKLSIDPKVFVPGDNGGLRDFTTINYQLTSPGFFANVKIYDQQGRKVKQLANGASLNTSGFFRWDGTSDNGRLARIGYHIVVFELYDSTGKSETLRETVVVGRTF